MDSPMALSILPASANVSVTEPLMKALPVVAWLLSLSVAVIASFVDDILQAIENAVDCGSCHTLLAALEPVVFLGDDVFVDVLVGVCKATGVEDDDVCEGVIREQAPIIAHDLRETSAFGKAGTRLCNALFGLCQQPDVTAYKVPILKTPPATPKAWQSTGKAPFQVVHFSDAHIDRSYQAGTDANCSKPICCRPYADYTGPVQIPAGPLGSHGCDTPTSLAQSMLGAVKGQNTKFSIFTGDVVEASVWLVDQKGVTSDLQEFNNELATLLNSPVYPTIGNHEVAPVNAFPRNTSTDAPSAQWVFDTQAAGWTPWIGGSAADSVRHMSGSYSSIVQGTNLKVLSLNTVYWYRQNFWLYDSDDVQPDPNGIISFASRELQAAEDTGQRVWIIAHMPPSSGDAIYDQSNYFDQLVQRYRSTIAAQFYGHSHEDEFAIAYSDYTKQSADTATSIAYIAPSLTPRNANPAFRVYDVDPDTYEIMDSRTLVGDMDDPTFQQAPSWKQEYSARETYAPVIGGWPASRSLTPAFWHKVTEAFVLNDAIFQKYNALKTRNYKVTACAGDCKNQTICAQRALRAENGCHVATPGFHWRRAEGEVLDSHLDHCEGTGLADIFWKVSVKVKTFGSSQFSTGY